MADLISRISLTLLSTGITLPSPANWNFKTLSRVWHSIQLIAFFQKRTFKTSTETLVSKAKFQWLCFTDLSRYHNSMKKIEIEFRSDDNDVFHVLHRLFRFESNWCLFSAIVLLFDVRHAINKRNLYFLAESECTYINHI